MNASTLIKTLSDFWAISNDSYLAYFSHASMFLKHSFNYVKKTELEIFKPIANNSDNNYKNFDEAPKGSIAIITSNGVMTKDDQDCDGNVGTITIANRIRFAANHKNIDAIIIDIDSGGGAVSAIRPIIEAMAFAKSKKPVIALFDTMASGALISYSNADKIIAKSEISQIGSLGVMASFKDSKPVAEKEGVVFHEVYSSLSKDKNKAQQNALKGDYKLLISEHLDPLADHFIKKVKTDRGHLIKDESVYSAKTFYAKEALEIGLIDHIGTIEFSIAKAYELSAERKSTNTNINTDINTNASTKTNTSMNKNKIPILLSILDIAFLESKASKYHLSAEDVKLLQDRFLKDFNSTLSFTGASFEDDGSMQISEKGLFALNAEFSNNYIARQDSATTKIVTDLQDQINILSKQADDDNVLHTKKSKTLVNDFSHLANDLNALESRPWNMAAMQIANTGDKTTGNILLANGITDTDLEQIISDFKASDSDIDISQMNDILGAVHREGGESIHTHIIENQEVNKLFPRTSTGIKDVYTSIHQYISEYLQPEHPGDWASKGTEEFQAEDIEVKNWQVTRTFLKSQIMQFIKSWLGTKIKGSDPYQPTFIKWFIANMFKQISLVERPLNAIRGVYVKPKTDAPGRSVNSTDGVFKTLQNLIKSNRIMPTEIGAGSFVPIVNGEINREHIYFKIEDLIKTIPQKLRDQFQWNVYISKDAHRAKEEFFTTYLTAYPNFIQQAKALSHNNFSYISTPNWVDGLIIITVKNNIFQTYREKADDNRMYIEKLKRNIHVHMDGAGGTGFALTGKQYSSKIALQASNYEYQYVYTNNEFGAYTSEPLLADVAVPSLLNHNVLETSENVAATVITSFADYEIGQKIYIKGGSNVNPSTIESSNANFIGLSSDIVLNENVLVGFIVTATDQFTLFYEQDANNTSAIVFNADDATPSLEDSYKFITSSENTAGNNEITGFTDILPGKKFVVIGGGGSTASVINKAGKFIHITANWTANEGNTITLLLRSDGLFIQLPN